MKKLYRPNLYLALVHYPVVNKNGDIVTSAVTNLDLHDMARAAKTYGVKTFYVVTPLHDQKILVNKIVNHWVQGVGGEYNSKRKQALSIIEVTDSLQEVKEDIQQKEAGILKTIATSAKENSETIKFHQLKDMISSIDPYLLIFGTAWGLSHNLIQESDYILEPIKGSGDYNHLSVRSATAIILDKILGRD